MKRERIRRHRKCINLVELVRNRSRYQPYDFIRNGSLNQNNINYNSSYSATLNSRYTKQRCQPLMVTTHRHLENNIGNCNCSHPNLPVMVTRTEHVDRSTNTNITNTSMQTQAEPVIQTTSAVSGILQQPFNKENTPNSALQSETIMTEDKNTNTSPTNISNTNTINLNSSKVLGVSRKATLTTTATSTHSSAIFIMGRSSNIAESSTSSHSEPSQTQLESKININHNNQLRSIDNAELTESDYEDEDEASVNEESQQQIGPQINESSIEHVATRQLITDEEAGGDGHHNNSVIEIEITLRSSNETNSDDDDDDDENEDAHTLDNSE